MEQSNLQLFISLHKEHTYKIAISWRQPLEQSEQGIKQATTYFKSLLSQVQLWFSPTFLAQAWSKVQTKPIWAPTCYTNFL